MEVIFLCHRVPFPPDKGDKIRSWHVLRRLTERYDVHLGCLLDDPADAAHLPALEQICASVGAFALASARAHLRAVRGLFAGEPLSLACFHDPRLARWAEETR